MNNCTINSNTVYDIGSAIYALGTDPNTVTDVTFDSNTADNGDTIVLLFSDTTFTNITLQNNMAYADTTGIFATFATVTIAESTFTTVRYPYGTSSAAEALEYAYTSGCFISISAGAKVSITDNEFSNGYADSGGFIYISGNSEITISGSTFTGGYANLYGGAIYSSGHKKLDISSCTFTDNIAYSSGSALYLSSGTAEASNVDFVAIPNYNAVYVSGGNFTGSALTFTNSDSSSSEYSDALLGGGIYVSNPDEFSLTSCEFTGLDYAYQGGAVYMETSTSGQSSSIPDDPSFTITSCTFTSNSATYGGAIYASSVDYLEVKSSTFTSNSAANYDSDISLSGSGGGIYYSSSTSYSQVVFESGNTFTSNSAENSGGAVYWNYNQPDNLTSNTYSSNSADLYGDDYA